MSYLSYGLDPNQKKIIQLLMKLPKRSTNKIGQYNYPNIEQNNSLKENYTGVLTINQEQIQTISASDGADREVVF
jgi:hypothetical protein